LSYATAELVQVPLALADYPAAAIELIHTYSLVHDDLPAMDDDDLRRGKPTVHRAFDEATAILVGDALLTYAFELLATADAEPSLVTGWVKTLASSAGARGMIEGQSTDIAGESASLPLVSLKKMHRQKSGALISASLTMVASAKSNEEFMTKLVSFGHHIGLAFQIRDDILDVESTTEKLGKPQGSDEASDKSTFVSLLGLNEAHAQMHHELEEADAVLSEFGPEAEGLRWIASFIVGRDR
jgi:geranylgeranyl pyrophosphate synthase